MRTKMKEEKEIYAPENFMKLWIIYLSTYIPQHMFVNKYENLRYKERHSENPMDWSWQTREMGEDLKDKIKHIHNVKYKKNIKEAMQQFFYDGDKFPNFMSLENETVIFATNTSEITTQTAIFFPKLPIFLPS